MANDCGDLKESGCELESFEKNNYFYGKLISARDMTLEQRTNERKLYTVNRLVMGSGLVCGLNTSLVKDKNGKLVIDNGNVMVTIEPGLAIDGCGRLIVVSIPYKVTFPADRSSPIYFYIKYRNCLREAVPVSDTSNACQENCCFNRIREVFEVVSSDNDLLHSKEIAEKKNSILNGIKPGANSGLDIAQAYYNTILQSGCAISSELVLLGVFTKDSGNWVPDTTETYACHSIVYDNVMLYDIIKILNKRIDDLSAQKPQVEVPDVVCKAKPCTVKVRDVEKTLKDDHKLVADEQPDETETDDKDLVGCIYKQAPDPGKKVDEGSKVKIWAYKEKQTGELIVPDVFKKTEEEAKQIFIDSKIDPNLNNFIVKYDRALEKYDPQDPRLDRVYKQEPVANEPYEGQLIIHLDGLKVQDYVHNDYTVNMMKALHIVENDGFTLSDKPPNKIETSDMNQDDCVVKQDPPAYNPVLNPPVLSIKKSKTVITFTEVYQYKSPR